MSSTESKSSQRSLLIEKIESCRKVSEGLEAPLLAGANQTTFNYRDHSPYHLSHD